MDHARQNYIAQTEALSNDPVQASTYGMMIPKAVTPNLVEWTSTPGEGYGDLEENILRNIEHAFLVPIFSFRGPTDEEAVKASRLIAKINQLLVF